jgi:hypothetical protein
MSFDQMHTRRGRRPAALICVLTLFAALLGLVSSSVAATRQTPACVQFWPETRYRNDAYDHIVHVSNACHAQAICMVSSDVTPAPLRTDLKAGENAEVWLARGSAASEFTPRVECGLVL